MKILQRIKTGRENAGLTLVEVIVSITILACISIPLMAYFSQSLQYSVVTAKQQKATALAQNLTEGLKSQQSLLQPVSGNSNQYTIPYLEKTGAYTVAGVSGNGYTTSGQPCLQSDLSLTGLPIGTLKYSAIMYENGTSVSGSAVSGNARKYAVDITLSTESELNEGQHPILYGMDDATDIVAIEENQITEAVTYFKSINEAYGSGSSLTPAVIQDKMDRTIVVEYDYDSTEPCYVVKVYYIFACKGLRGPGEADTTDKIQTMPLSYTKIESPQNLYLMFNRVHPMIADDHDRIMIELTDNVPPSVVLPDLFLVVQNLSDNATEYLKDGYDIELGIGGTSVFTPTLNSVKIHSNLIKLNESGGTEYKYANTNAFVNIPYDIEPENSYAHDNRIDDPMRIFEITDQSQLIRVINIVTEVYDLKSDGITRGDKLATYQSSKGE